MGFQKKPIANPPPDKYNNLELMKIPNFLHLTPDAIERQCKAIKSEHFLKVYSKFSRILHSLAVGLEDRRGLFETLSTQERCHQLVAHGHEYSVRSCGSVGYALV